MALSVYDPTAIARKAAEIAKDLYYAQRASWWIGNVTNREKKAGRKKNFGKINHGLYPSGRWGVYPLKKYTRFKNKDLTIKKRYRVYDSSVKLKSFDTFGTVDLTATGTFTILNAPVLGTDLYNRVGRRICMKSIQLGGFVRLKVSQTATSVMGRIILFYDAQPNGAAPVLGDILRDSTVAATASNFGFINLNNRSRFKIIRDYQMNLNACTSNAGGQISNLTMKDNENHSYNIDWYERLPKLETVYNATNGGTVADITTGTLYLLTIATSGTSWEFDYGSRVRYYD